MAESQALPEFGEHIIEKQVLERSEAPQQHTAEKVQAQREPAPQESVFEFDEQTKFEKQVIPVIRESEDTSDQSYQASPVAESDTPVSI